MYHVWTAGGRKDRRFRMGTHGWRKSSGVVFCGVSSASADFNAVSPDAAQATIDQARAFPNHINTNHLCPECVARMQER